MQKKQFIFLVLCTALLCSSTCKLFAQTTEPHIYKDWTVLGETVYQAEISYRIIKCEIKNQIHLSINNKSSSVQNVVALLTIKNDDDGATFNKDLNQLVLMNSVVKAECVDDPDLNNLKIDLPANYNPDNLTITIQFPTAFLLSIKNTAKTLQQKF